MRKSFWISLGLAFGVLSSAGAALAQTHSWEDRRAYEHVYNDRDFDYWFQHRFNVLHDRIDDLTKRGKLRNSVSKDIWSNLKQTGEDEHQAFKAHRLDNDTARRFADRLDDIVRRLRRESREDWDDRDGHYAGFGWDGRDRHDDRGDHIHIVRVVWQAAEPGHVAAAPTGGTPAFDAILDTCEGRSNCEIQISNTWFVAHNPRYLDPYPGLRKSLLVDYSCGPNSRNHLEGAEGGRLTLGCGWMR
jgi:hypothetical protein